ncbi:MAG: (2Fe-2S)-binding protein [Clostridia bacterium]|nr:(2Fe-2S)-binding protein [Clostridia bacterium]
MTENYMVCNCKKVSYWDIADELNKHSKFDDVMQAFEDVKEVTHCSTGCGGCHDKVLDVISEILMGHKKV